MAITLGTLATNTSQTAPWDTNVTLSDGDALLVAAPGSAHDATNDIGCTFDPGGANEIVNSTPVIEAFGPSVNDARGIFFFFAASSLPGAGTFAVRITDASTGNKFTGSVGLFPIKVGAGNVAEVRQSKGFGTDSAAPQTDTISLTFDDAIVAGSLVVHCAAASETGTYIFADLATELIDATTAGTDAQGVAYEIGPAETTTYVVTIDNVVDRLAAAVVEIAEVAGSGISIPVSMAAYRQRRH